MEPIVEPEPPPISVFNVTPQTFTVSSVDGDQFPINGISESLDTIFEDIYSELRDFRIVSVDNANAVISDDKLTFSYTPSPNETQTVVTLTLNSVENDNASVEIPYTLKFVDMFLDDLIDATIDNLNIPENHKELIRSLPNELNVFHKNGANEYNIAKIEAVSYVFDRVENGTDVFKYEEYLDDNPFSILGMYEAPVRTFSQEKIDSVARHAFALASVIDFNQDTIEYHDGDFQRIAEALDDVTDETLIGRDYEPFYWPSLDVDRCKSNNITDTRRVNSNLICIDGVTYGLSDKGVDYHLFVSTDRDFYLRNKGEDIAIQAIQDRFGNPVQSLIDLNDEQFSYFHDNALLIGLREFHKDNGATLSFGNLRFKSNVDNYELGTNFNIYNLTRLYIGASSTPQEAIENFLDNRRENLYHFLGLPHLTDSIGYPGSNSEDVEALRNIYEKYNNVTSVAFIPAVAYLLPEKLDGVIYSGSTNFSGVLSSVLKNLNIPSVQVNPIHVIEDFSYSDYKHPIINSSEILLDLNNDGVPERNFIEGNNPFNTDRISCEAFISFEDLPLVLNSSNFHNSSRRYCSNN